ncbi:hypothetical protein [Sulfurimonas hydrogeniphila]|uniref:hypothetical protein n=1 Tax=Sulfurimonas hydrogeniphila TaxID=2509341 RepID=UPI00125F3479|nr:hypothetical protein [Sulfurimonas hydrogeniphila]
MKDEEIEFTLPKELYEQLKHLAESSDMSIEDISIAALEAFVKKYKNYTKDEYYKERGEKTYEYSSNN